MKSLDCLKSFKTFLESLRICLNIQEIECLISISTARSTHYIFLQESVKMRKVFPPSSIRTLCNFGRNFQEWPEVPVQHETDSM